MQTLEAWLQQLYSSSGAPSVWLALYYSFLAFLLGLLVLMLLTRRIIPWIMSVAQEEHSSNLPRKLRVAWAAVTLLAPFYLYCRMEGHTANIFYRLAASVFFLCLVYVGTEVSLLLVMRGFFRRVLKFNFGVIFRDLLRMIIYVLALVSIVRDVFEIADLSSLLAVSSAASIIVGLALQNTLGNIFSGLFLQIDSPISLNDWVLIEGEEGRVSEVTWYSTKIITRENLLVSIPNQRVGNAVIKNFSRPTLPVMMRKRIGVSYDCPPNRVKSALIAHMKQVPGVIAEPAPNVILVDYADSSITYEVRFWVDDLPRWTLITDAVMTGVWYHLKRAEMEIPFPIRTVLLKRPHRDDGSIHRIVQLLCKIDFLATLEPKELEIVAGDLKHLVYARGERVVVQGDPGETFFIIWSGAVAVKITRGDTEVPVARLEAGQYFGEMSLLTGEPRRATIQAEEDTELLCLDRNAFGILLARNPGVAERMSKVLAHRLAEAETRIADKERDTLIRRRAASTEDTMYGKIMSGIRNIFGV